MGGGASSAGRPQRFEWPVVHRINTLEDLAQAHRDRVVGLECDVRWHEDRWWVAHDASYDLTLDAWVAAWRRRRWRALQVVYVDVKTPHEDTSPLLGPALEPLHRRGIRVLVGMSVGRANRHALWNCAPWLELAFDTSFYWHGFPDLLREIQRHKRPFWIGQGNLPGWPAWHMHDVFHWAQTHRSPYCQGLFSWTYRTASSWWHDVTRYPLRLTMVEPALWREWMSGQLDLTSRDIS